MEHISIKRAFENAKGAGEDKGTENSDDVIIYLIFQRLTLCCKDIYYILTGNKEQVAKAIEKCYEKTEQNKKEDWDSDEIRALETPFDTHCVGHCKTIGIKECRYHDKKDKCASNWFHHEFKCQNEIDEFIKTMPNKLEHPRGRFEIWDMTEHGLIQRKE
jgi:hypothetical protein